MAMKIYRKQIVARRQSGMTMLELMIAMVVLAVGVLGSMGLIIRAIEGDGWSKQMSNSTVMAQMVTERIMAVPANNNGTVTITDCANVTTSANTSPGGPAVGSSGNLDFTAAPVTGYQMIYTDCDTNGRQAVYDVRWNVQAIGGTSYAKLLTVSAQLRSAGRNAIILAPVVTIRTIVGQGT